MSFAGVSSTWTDKHTGEVIDSFSILTTTPNKEMAKIHDRMPVILSKAEESIWLDKSNETEGDIIDLLDPTKNGSLDIYQVSQDVNSVRNNNKELIKKL